MPSGTNRQLPANEQYGGVARDPDAALVDEPLYAGLAFLQKVLEHVFAGWKNVSATIVLDGVMLFGDRWQVFRVSLLHGNRAAPLARVVVKGKGLVKVARLKNMSEKVQRFLKRHVQEVLFLADAGFRDWDWVGITGFGAPATPI